MLFGYGDFLHCAQRLMKKTKFFLNLYFNSFLMSKYWIWLMEETPFFTLLCYVVRSVYNVVNCHTLCCIFSAVFNNCFSYMAVWPQLNLVKIFL